MRRRKLLIGLGSGAGIAGLIGSGAFSNVSADRDVSINVADDSDALLALEPANTPNGNQYAESTSDGELALDFSKGSSGVGTDSAYEFDDVFRIKNQGTQTVYVWSTFSGSSGNLGVGDADTDVWLYPDGNSDRKLRDSNEEVLALPVGESILVGVHIDTEAVTSDQTLTMTLNADVEKPTFSGALDDTEQTFTVVDQASGSGDYSTIQGAIDAEAAKAVEDRSPIYVRSGTYSDSKDKPVEVDADGLTIQGPNFGVSGDGNRGPEAIVEGRIVVTADDVALDGFDVSPPPADSSTTNAAIQVSGTANGVVVKNNVVRDFESEVNNTYYSAEGITVFGGDSTTPISDVTVFDNYVRNLKNEGNGGATAFSVQGNVDGATVEDNTVADVGEEVTSYGFGAVVRGTSQHNETPSNVTIRNNDINRVLSDPSGDFFGVGLGVEADGTAITFENNDVDDVGLGVEFKAGVAETTLSGNDFATTTYHLGDTTGNVDPTGVLANNTFDGAAALDSVEANSIRPGGKDPYKRVIAPEIQGAVDVAASGANANIDVAPGTYDEAITIDSTNDLTIVSTQGSGSTTIEPSAADDDNVAITIDGATGITVDDFEVTFDGDESPNAEKYAIRALAGSDDLTVKNCDVGGFTTSGPRDADDDGESDVNAVRSVGISITGNQGSSGSAVANPTISNNTLEGINCEGSTIQDGILDDDSRGIGLALRGDVSGATVSGNGFRDIGGVSNDPSGAQISSVDAVGPGDSNGNQYTTSGSDNQAAEGTDKPRGITITGGTATDFVIENNVLGGTGSDAIAGVYGQPAIFVGGDIGSNHDVRNNNIYHPVDNLGGGSASPLELNGDNTWYDTSGSTQSPSLVSPDEDKDGGNLIDRAGGTGDEYNGYSYSP